MKVFSKIASILLILSLLFAGCAVRQDLPETTETSLSAETTENENHSVEAKYLGVYGYGTEIAKRENMDSFRYRFEIDGEERLLTVDNGDKKEDGSYSYPVQNALKIGYTYVLTIEDDVVTNAEEILTASSDPDLVYSLPVTGEPGLKTVGNFLKTAMAPVGTTLYIYGGGWDWQDEGGSVQVRSIGVSGDWVRFFRSQNADFTYRDRDGDEANIDPEHSYYPYNEYNEYYYAGLDCSGFVSWALNNTFNKETVELDLFSGSTKTAYNLAQRGYGSITQDASAPVYPGDVISIKGHVWVSLGTCDDGSILLLHSTPS
ncbi:MAG: hypothetical protein II776_07980, partial [Clostridia bacterium]|nr:hypothetical protein [Clostridia bacterium]